MRGHSDSEDGATQTRTDQPNNAGGRRVPNKYGTAEQKSNTEATSKTTTPPNKNQANNATSKIPTPPKKIKQNIQQDPRDLGYSGDSGDSGDPRD